MIYILFILFFRIFKFYTILSILLSETSKQVQLPRKQCLLDRDRHRHATNKDMDSD